MIRWQDNVSNFKAIWKFRDTKMNKDEHHLDIKYLKYLICLILSIQLSAAFLNKWIYFLFF